MPPSNLHVAEPKLRVKYIQAMPHKHGKLTLEILDLHPTLPMWRSLLGVAGRPLHKTLGSEADRTCLRTRKKDDGNEEQNELVQVMTEMRSKMNSFNCIECVWAADYPAPTSPKMQKQAMGHQHSATAKSTLNIPVLIMTLFWLVRHWGRLLISAGTNRIRDGLRPYDLEKKITICWSDKCLLKKTNDKPINRSENERLHSGQHPASLVSLQWDYNITHAFQTGLVILRLHVRKPRRDGHLVVVIPRLGNVHIFQKTETVLAQQVSNRIQFERTWHKRHTDNHWLAAKRTVRKPKVIPGA